MRTFNETEVAQLLTEIGQLTELAGESPFKSRAYYQAAETLGALTEPLAEIVAAGKLRTLPGVGEAIAEKILKLHKTGTHPALERLREEYPSGLLEILRIPGLGPKKTAVLYQTLQISSLDGLEHACRAGLVRNCKGFGAKLEARILEGIAFLRKNQTGLLSAIADESLKTACEYLAQAHPDWSRITPAGAARRGCEVVDELIVVAQTGPMTPASGGTGCPWHTLAFQSNVRVLAAPAGCYGLALLFGTGSRSHVASLQSLAASQGLTLSEKGFFRDSEPLPCAEEREIYRALGLSYIEPELREGGQELEAARQPAQPRLIEMADMRGVLHCHSTFSDGMHTLAEMAEAVRQRGYHYFGITDHSQAVTYAGGMSEAMVYQQMREIESLNAQYRGSFRIFKGIESDILADGSLDYPEAVLKNFDFVVASIHSLFTLDERAQTERMLAAIANPHTTILGHPTGRLLQQRPGYKFNMEAVLQACARQGVAVEINANPHRLDLDWRLHSRALALGCRLSINPDAHAQGELDYVRLGVRVARKGGVGPDKVLNCMDLDAFSRYLQQRKKLTIAD